jgi:hypothetical protein
LLYLDLDDGELGHATAREEKTTEEEDDLGEAAGCSAHADEPHKRQRGGRKGSCASAPSMKSRDRER